VETILENGETKMYVSANYRITE